MASIVAALRSVLSGSSSETTNDPRQDAGGSVQPALDEEQAVYEAAKSMSRRTGFEFMECVILVATDEGYDDGDIATMVGRSVSTVRRQREQLRDRKHDLETNGVSRLDALETLD